MFDPVIPKKKTNPPLEQPQNPLGHPDELVLKVPPPRLQQQHLLVPPGGEAVGQAGAGQAAPQDYVVVRDGGGQGVRF